MGHGIDFSLGRAAVAYAGSKDDVWHRLGREKMDPKASVQDWADAACMNYGVVQEPLFAGDSLTPCKGFLATIRNDTRLCLGVGSERRKELQPIELLEWISQYVKDDDRFGLDAAGVLDGGRRIWATAVFQEPVTVAGDNHKARLLMSTAYDGTASTVNIGTMTRVICRNTMFTALSCKDKSVIKTRHSTKFDPIRVGKELACIVQGFDQYKAMGEAMARKHLDDDKIVGLFRHLLDIAPEDKAADLSTRKLNQFDALSRAYDQTCRETNDTHKGTAWSALNAVTRYIDHDRSTRSGDGASADETRFMSAQFGSGAALKERAVAYLDDICDGDLLRAGSAKTANDGDVSSILRQGFRSSIGN